MATLELKEVVVKKNGRKLWCLVSEGIPTTMYGDRSEMEKQLEYTGTPTCFFAIARKGIVEISPRLDDDTFTELCVAKDGSEVYCKRPTAKEALEVVRSATVAELKMELV